MDTLGVVWARRLLGLRRAERPPDDLAIARADVMLGKMLGLVHPDGRELGTIYDGLAQLEKDAGNMAVSLGWLERAVDVKTRGYGADARTTLISRANLGSRLIEFGDHAAGRRWLEPTIAPLEAIFGPRPLGDGVRAHDVRRRVPRPARHGDGATCVHGVRRGARRASGRSSFRRRLVASMVGANPPRDGGSAGGPRRDRASDRAVGDDGTERVAPARGAAWPGAHAARAARRPCRDAGRHARTRLAGFAGGARRVKTGFRRYRAGYAPEGDFDEHLATVQYSGAL